LFTQVHKFADLRCRGLTLRLTSGNARSWSFRFRDRETRELYRETIGPHPEITLAQARAKADELRRRVAARENPVQERRKHRQEATSKTFEALAGRYMREHSWRKKRSAPADDRILKLHILPHLARRPYEGITRAEVIEVLERIVGESKHALANRTQALISGIFSFGVEAGLLTANPVARLKKRGVERARERTLSDAEIRLF
jgi:hypothetical protein